MVLHRVLQQVAVNQRQRRDPSKSTSHAALHTRWCVVWSRTSPGLLVSYRGEDAGEKFVCKLQEEADQLFQEYIGTPQQLLKLTEALLPHCHQLSHMQPAAGRGQSA